MKYDYLNAHFDARKVVLKTYTENSSNMKDTTQEYTQAIYNEIGYGADLYYVMSLVNQLIWSQTP